jgi:hypothetical protein
MYRIEDGLLWVQTCEADVVPEIDGAYVPGAPRDAGGANDFQDDHRCEAWNINDYLTATRFVQDLAHKRKYPSPNPGDAVCTENASSQKVQRSKLLVFYYGYKAVTPCTRARKGHYYIGRSGAAGVELVFPTSSHTMIWQARCALALCGFQSAYFGTKSFLFHHVYIAASRVASGLTRGLVLLSYADGFNIPALQICSIVSAVFDRVLL